MVRADIDTGTPGSSPAFLAVNQGTLFLRAKTIYVGAELFKIEIGASAQSIGTGCSANGVAPTLVATDPVWNGSLSFRVGSAPSNASGILLLGLPGGPTAIGGGCLLHLNVALPTFSVPMP